MRIAQIFLCCFCAVFLSRAGAQVQILDSGKVISLRGLSVVNNDIVWASGSNGTVVRSTDGGKHLEWIQVPGFTQRDFRDIEAFDAHTAVIMAIAEPAQILRTTDGGKSWKIVFTDSSKGMFLDAMHFAGARGTVVGDPINKYPYIAQTSDSGKTWRRWNRRLPETTEGEAFFASSGTNLSHLKDPRYSVALVTGGKRSRLLLLSRNGSVFPSGKPLPLLQQGKESTGANSIAMQQNNAVIVGGDFLAPRDSLGNCIVTRDGGNTWLTPLTPPRGYRSCVCYISKNQLISCGLTGVDISEDGGMNWRLVSETGFHVVQKAANGDAVFLVGGRGKIARWTGK